jgi:hypothetical protein
MSKIVYVIKKIMVDADGKKMHVLMTDNHSEILELTQKSMANKMAEIMNANSDSGWFYEVIEITNNRED